MRILYFIFFIVLILFWIVLIFGGLTGTNLFKKYSDLIFKSVLILALIIGIVFLSLIFIGLR